MLDSPLLEAAKVPGDFPIGTRRLVFLWQPCSRRTLARLRRTCPAAAILVGRFEAETAVHDAGLDYWAVTDFLSWRSLIDFERAALDARLQWTGPAQPKYQGMPLVDGDLPRHGVWSELVACAAVLLMVRRAAPGIEVVSDWMGSQVARAVGLRTRRLWRADLCDPNWPVRRWLREHTWGRGDATAKRLAADAETRASGPPDPPASRDQDRPDIVFLLGGWVEPRLLAGFPIEPLQEAGYRCELWVYKRSEALEQLIARTHVRCVDLGFPPPAPDVKPLQRQVGRWCAAAAEAGFFAPLRGRPARRLIALMGWDRWAAKLVAMHRVMTRRLEMARPRLLIAPIEKDWAIYCGHYAARGLGIRTVGIKHAVWLPGSHLERYDHGCWFPPAADHVLAYTPADEHLCREVYGSRGAAVVWRGNPRLETCVPVTVGPSPAAVRVLVTPCGVGPGFGYGLRKRVIPANIRLIDALRRRLGDQVRVRLHPWDSPAHYPPALQHVFLTPGPALETHLAECHMLVTTYSQAALDAAAAGRPVFLWDPEHLNMGRCELAREGAAIVEEDLDRLCDAVERFVWDADYRRGLSEQAARFPRYLRDRLPGATASMTQCLTDYLASLVEPAGGPSM